MIDELANRVWANPRLAEWHGELKSAWLHKVLGIDHHLAWSDDQVGRCVQAAAILAATNEPDKQRVAYAIAACALDLFESSFPGLPGLLRVVLSRTGNFPAMGVAKSVDSFAGLSDRAILSEERRRFDNEITVGANRLTLTDFQRALWDHLVGRKSVAISAPTSAGKSFVLQTYLRHQVGNQELSRACYLVPTRALIGQVTDSIAEWRLADRRTDVSIVNVPVPSDIPLPDRGIFVLTQERAHAILNSHVDFRPDLIICDEAQTIEEGSRGVLLHTVIDRLLERNINSQLIFAGPNISNLDIFKRTFNLDDVVEVQSRSPSVLQNLIVVNTRSVVKGQVVVDAFQPEGRVELATVDMGRHLPSIRERLVRVADRFSQRKPSIVYANGPAEAEKVASGLAEVGPDAPPSERVLELAAFVRNAIHDEYELARCIERGVGFHYGRIPSLVRRAVEDAFSGGDIRFLVTTSTLIQGVNFPAANLFVCNPKKGTNPLDRSEFWNLAGRAGRLGKEFQGNVFLIDYDEWPTQLAEGGNEIAVHPFLESALQSNVDEIESCATAQDPVPETPTIADVESAFARLLSDHFAGRLDSTFDKYGVSDSVRKRLTDAVAIARSRIDLPSEVLSMSPTVSALRQQRLANYLRSEIKGGGKKRLEELIPRNPRDEDAYRALSEIYRIGHEQIWSQSFPRLHVRMAAISLKWMRGEPLPAIIDENHRRSRSSDIAASIRGTLDDIERDVRFRYFRLTSCYSSILSYILRELELPQYLSSVSPLPSFLEVGASDPTMISLINLGVSRLTARVLMETTLNKDMTLEQARAWLRSVDLERLQASPIVKDDIRRALASLTAAG